jgi:hypothetical protein
VLVVVGELLDRAGPRPVGVVALRRGEQQARTGSRAAAAFGQPLQVDRDRVSDDHQDGRGPAVPSDAACQRVRQHRGPTTVEEHRDPAVLLPDRVPVGAGQPLGQDRADVVQHLRNRGRERVEARRAHLGDVHGGQRSGRRGGDRDRVGLPGEEGRLAHRGPRAELADPRVPPVPVTDEDPADPRGNHVHRGGPLPLAEQLGAGREAPAGQGVEDLPYLVLGQALEEGRRRVDRHAPHYGPS